MDILREYKQWWMDYRNNLSDYWKGDEDRLFIQADGKPIFPDTINFWLTRFCMKNGFAHIHPHGLRHTFISLKLANGVDVRTLCGESGHAQPSTLLDTYSHVISSAKERSVRTLDEVLLGLADCEDDGAD